MTTEKHSPNWLLKKIESSKTDAHKLLHIIEFQSQLIKALKQEQSSPIDSVGWVSIESDEQPEKVTSVLVKYKDGTKEVALFDGDGRYYIESEDKDITDDIAEWHRLP